MSDKDPETPQGTGSGTGSGSGSGTGTGEPKGGRARSPWSPVESLRNEVDRLFEEFDKGVWSPVRRSVAATEPFWRRELTWTGMPVADLVEKEDRYEIAAELPGLDEKDVEVAVAAGSLTIKGEKLEEKEETRKDYHLQERRFGSFERRFPLPDDVDAERIDARFRKGVLTVVLPKTEDSRKRARKIDVKGG